MFLLFSPVSVNRGRACLPRSATAGLPRSGRPAQRGPPAGRPGTTARAPARSRSSLVPIAAATSTCLSQFRAAAVASRPRSLGDLCRVTERGELDQPYAAGVLPDPPGRGVQRQRGLAAAARAGQRDQACVIDQAVYLSPSAPLRGTKLVSSTGRLCRCASSERSGGTRLADPWYSCHTRSAGPRSSRVHDHSATVDST